MIKKFTNFKWLLSLMLVVFVGSSFAQSPTTPLNESFEGETFPPEGWAIINDGGSNTWERVQQSEAHTGDFLAQIMYSSEAHDDWLITPGLLPEAENSTLSFWASSSEYFPEEFNVKLSTTGISKEDFTVTLASNETAPEPFGEFSYDLSAYIGQVVYIGVQAISQDQNWLRLDDFTGPNINPVTAAPDAAIYSTPLNGANDIENGSSLTWEFGANTYEYQLMLGTTNPPTETDVVVDFTSTLATSYTLADLESNTTYYWQINAKNTVGTTVGEIWSFTTAEYVPTPPGCATITEPADGAEDVNLYDALGWTAGSGSPTGYRLYLGTDGEGTETPTNSIDGEDLGDTGIFYLYGNVDYSNTYYWQIIPYNEDGDAEDCAIYSFTTVAMPAPGQITNSSPSDGATGIGVGRTINWNPSYLATEYQLKLDTENPPVNVVMDFEPNTTVTSYTISDLEPSTEYFWQVIAKNNTGTVEGEVWSFTSSADIVPPVATFYPVNGASNVPINVNPTIKFNEPIYYNKWGEWLKVTNGNVAEVVKITYEVENPAEDEEPIANVEFTATIENNIITVTPTADLANVTEYTLNVVDVRDEATNVLPGTSIIFTTVSSEAPETYTVTFTVNDGTNPIMGADVMMGPDMETTNADGVAIFTDIPNGLSGYVISKEGYNDSFGEFTVDDADLEIAVTMTPVPETYTVTFSVVNGNGELTAKVGGNTITTGAEVEEGNKVIFTAAPADGYQVKVWKLDDNIVDGTTTYTITNLQANATVTVEFEAIPSYTVTLTVVSETTPIEGATVTFDGAEYTTDTEGIVVISEVIDGTYAYTVTMTNYVDEAGNIVVDGANVEQTINLEIINSIDSGILSNLSVYPNPFSSEINITNADMVNRVTITNILGQHVMDITLNGQETITTNNLTNGVYLITFEGMNGERTIRKMIKK